MNDPHPQNDATNNEENTCRICLLGAEEEAALGKLISPCKCKGTMKYVHLECLNMWRSKSVNSKSFFQCDQCKYKYSFRRTAIAKYLTHQVTISFLTVLAFLVMIFVSGFITKLFLILFMSPPLTPDEKRIYSDEDNFLEGFYFVDDISLTRIDTFHFLYGSFLVGLVGCFGFFFNMIATPMNRGGLRRNGNIGTIILVIFIIVGIIRVFMKTYDIVKQYTAKIMSHVEDRVLNQDEF